MMYISILGILGLEELDNVGMDILLTDPDNNDYFFDNNIPNAHWWLRSLFLLQSEEHIRNLGCLEWRSNMHYEHTDFGETVVKVFYELVSTLGYTSYGGYVEDMQQASSIVELAVYQQLQDFRHAKNWLEETPGIFYFITDGDRWVGNVQENDPAEFFRSQPVYLISEAGKAKEHSRRSENTRYTYTDIDFGIYYDVDTYGSVNETSYYIAFSSDVVELQNARLREEKQQLINQLILIAAPLAVAVALAVTLIIGAGRKYDDETGEVHFARTDKIWLDIGLLVVLLFEAVVLWGFFEIFSATWHYANAKFAAFLAAALSVLLTLPPLWWTVSFAKRFKAGKWWRHTAVYTLINWLVTFVKSLWSGLSLTLRVAALGGVLFVGTALCAFTELPGVGITLGVVISLAAVFGMLRYTRKLHLIEVGAKAASGGDYDKIAVTGGELGSIAASINNISDGINAAVAERLKSERFKTELITNISHDLRTPLTSLITYTDLLKNEGLDTEKAPEYLDILIQKSMRLKMLTDDLFEASKAASGSIEVNAEDIDLADFVRQALGELDGRVSESGLDFRLNLTEPAPVRADGKLLWRVVDNLLSNVFKYSLASSRVYVDIEKDNGEYRLDIKNISENPLNIDPSELIERFKRGDDARGGEGSGLGLSIAESFILAQNGRFELSIDGDLFKASLYLPAV